MQLPFLSLLAALALPLSAREAIQLIDPAKIDKVWSFNNGAEFPGATGGVKLDETVKREGRPTLKLTGDFTKGGLYVVTGRKLAGIDIQQLDFSIKAPGFDRLVLRINDSSGQTHQINVRVEPGGDWQQVVLPLERFFARRGQADAPAGISKYEYWGGAKDGKWHGPATDLYVLAPKGEKNELKELWLDEITITPPPKAEEVRQEIALDAGRDGSPAWNFTNGPEFKGATGSLEASGGNLKLAGDFTGGGAYVAMVRNLGELDVTDVAAIRMRVKSENAKSIGIQLVDATGQTHQRKGNEVTADGAWHDFEIVPAKIAGGEHWGGANDGKWHGPPRMISLSLTAASDEGKRPVIHYSDVRLDATRRVFAKAPAFTADFSPAGFPGGWKIEGSVTANPAGSRPGEPALRLSRPLDSLPREVSATGPEFSLSPGDWRIAGAFRPELESPDNSYHASVVLECFDASGSPVERLALAELTKTSGWQELEKSVTVPKGASRGRFRIAFQKTWGDLHVGSLSAAYLAPTKANQQTVSRVLFATGNLGNLLLPTDPRSLTFEVETSKELPADQREATLVVRDYWGSEHTRPLSVTLGPPVNKSGAITHAGKLDLASAPLETGRYYEIHASIPQDGGEPFEAFTSLAILPEAPNRKFKPEEVPFTSRNWDNRIPEYIRLSDRLGVRVCGLWGGWSSKPPYKPELPGLELCRELGMGWLTTTPAKFIEDGKTDFTEEALRQGARNFIQAYGQERPFIINLGNEPHGKGERVRKNVEAYRVIYEEMKKTDPTVHIISTSVEPNEEYFQNGYYKYCDAYDFHIYETPEAIRKTMRQYRELMKKYGSEKPLWSTELGLNSQGQTRLVVAGEVVKKVSSFFAEGGTNMSWFGILYPDPDGKSFGSSGDSHNVFDCRYKRYAPRLDAIAYYNMVNGVGIKKFVDEKTYADGIHAFLFRDRDGRAMQVLWKDRGRQDVSIPLGGVGEVTAIRIDGRLRQIDAAATSISVGVSADPLVLLYQGGPERLPEELGASSIAIQEAPAALARKGSTTITVATGGQPAEAIALVAPPFWVVEKTAATNVDSVEFKVTPPPASKVREADLTITHPRADLGLRVAVAE